MVSFIYPRRLRVTYTAPKLNTTDSLQTLSSALPHHYYYHDYYYYHYYYYYHHYHYHDYHYSQCYCFRFLRLQRQSQLREESLPTVVLRQVIQIDEDWRCRV